jgi:hypothetical protein
MGTSVEDKPLSYVRAIVKWNSGRGALLCNCCSKILAYGFEHEDKEHYCEDEECILNWRAGECNN